MTPVIFADACFWIALLNPRDAWHETVQLLYEEYFARPILTSEMVLAEVLNFMAKYGAQSRLATVDLIRRFGRDLNVDVEPQTSLQFWNAVEFYNARPDQEWGLVDCASFQLMTANNIREALTNDHHFTQAGFNILMQ